MQQRPAGPTELCGRDGQVEQGEHDSFHTRDSVGHTIGGTQRCLRPAFSERIGNSRRTGNTAALAYGVLYDLADSDGGTLDRVEGVHTGGYIRCSIQLRCRDGGTTSAVTYIASDRHVDPACVPFDWYRDLVVAGALEHGLPAPYIDELAQIPAVPDPDSGRSVQARRLLEGSDRPI